MPLTDPACRNATCPADKARVRLADAGGPYLEVAANGSKRWFVKYRFGGKEKRLALGAYPATSLKAARTGRDAARKPREAGTDPVQRRKADTLAQAASAATTFEAVARELHATTRAPWRCRPCCSSAPATSGPWSGPSRAPMPHCGRSPPRR